MSDEKKKKPMTDAQKKGFVVNTLRRASYRWPGRNDALKDANIGRNQYKCAMCPSDKIHPRKGVQIDHISPVVPLEGWDSWDGFIKRMFCEKDGYQVICIEHHDEKTKSEKEIRKKFKKKLDK